MQNRLNEIDLLRGFAVIGMVFSGILPFNGALPAWMYHAQVPPPNHIFDPTLAGLTWVDLVFPFFLFSMGAVIPAVLPQTIEKEGIINTFLQLFKRFLLLLALAVFSFNFAPLRNIGAGDVSDIVGLAAYASLFLVFFKHPDWLPRRTLSLKVSGLFLLLGLLYMKMIFWGGLDIKNNDSILRVLANVYFVGALLWYASKENELLRVGFIFMVLAAYLGDMDGGYMQNFWRWQDPWHLVSPYLLKYLIIFLLGTLAGDWLLKKENLVEKISFQWDYFILSIALTFSVLVGLFNRSLELTLLSCLLAFSFFYYRQKWKKKGSTDKNKIFYVGIFILFCGLFMEPFQGGVKKDPSTLSYFFISSGIAFIWVHAFMKMEKSKLSVFFHPLQSIGKNALMAYFMAGFLLMPLFNISGLGDIFGQSTLFLLFRAFIVTIVLGAIVQYCTKRGLFWKI
jgi:predicted acyltransferase